MTRDQHTRIIALYSAMPGAPMPSKEDGSYMWGDVEGNEHWAFCEAIIRGVDSAIGAAVSQLASDHNLV